MTVFINIYSYVCSCIHINQKTGFNDISVQILIYHMYGALVIVSYIISISKYG